MKKTDRQSNKTNQNKPNEQEEQDNPEEIEMCFLTIYLKYPCLGPYYGKL